MDLYYMLPLSAEQRDKLSDFTLTVFDAASNSYIFNKQDAPAILERLDLQVNAESPTGFDGIIGITVEPRVQIAKEELDNMFTIANGTLPQIFKDFLKKEAVPFLNQPIEVHHNDTMGQNIDFETHPLTILSGYSMVGNFVADLQSSQKVAWGTTLYSSRNYLNPPKCLLNGMFPIYPNDNPDLCIAIVSGDKNTLQLMVDLFKSNEDVINTHNLLIFKNIVAHWIKLRRDDTVQPIAVEAFDTRWIEDDDEFKRIIHPRDDLKERIRTKLATLRGNITSYKSQLYDCITRYEELSNELVTLEAAGPISKETYYKQIEELKRNPDILGIEPQFNKLVILTRTLYCEDPRSEKLHEIGAFMITLNFGTGVISWNNMTRLITTPAGSKMHAPHVFSNGEACLGNWDKTVPEMMARLDIATATTMAIMFIQQVNVDDQAGKYIDAWPVAQEKQQAA